MSAELLAEAKLALEGLKDFQRETVDHVHRSLFAPDSSRRFLVADEVGLGKTLIARGVVARSIESLVDKVDRIDVVYICSNGDIARQNINRLRIGKDRVALDTRLTLLPRHVNEMKNSNARLNFVAFTPNTSFDLRDGLGRIDERVLIYRMLRELWDLGSRAAPLNVLKGNANIETFRRGLDSESFEDIDPKLESTRAFGAQLTAFDVKAKQDGGRTLRERFDELCSAYPQARSSPGAEIAQARSRWVGEVRAVLAASCLAALEPDLIILDEFQRFSHLLDDQSEEADLARQLFSINQVRVLLLSATPYRMYTPAGETSGDDHYADFVRTVNFLERNERGPAAESIEPLLNEYREAMLELGTAPAAERLRSASRVLEQRLRRVMVRTERLSSTGDRNGMLVEVKGPPPSVTANDALGYVALSRIATAVEHHDPVEYWKSAPYPLSFMESEGYALTRGIDDATSDAQKRIAVARGLAAKGNHRLDVTKLENLEPIEAGNARFRALMSDTVEQGAHRLLWLPPALPYYQLAGPWASQSAVKLTKRLIFTSWRFVPRAIASLLSYEAERLMTNGRRRAGRGLLRFSMDEGRPTGMPVLALMYPSSFLAKACDPLVLSREARQQGVSPTAAAILELARERVELTLDKRIKHAPTDGPVDQRWYWAAPLLLDMGLEPEATLAWLEQPDLARAWAGSEEDDGQAWSEHVETAKRLAFEGAASLGRRPDDLVHVLAELGLGGPGPCLLRSMLRVVGLRTESLKEQVGQAIRTSAAAAASAFRQLYNQPTVTELLLREMAAREDEPFWRVALRYGVDGCIQGVLDEYAHVLRDHLGLAGGSGDEKVHEIAEQIRVVLSLRTANLAVKDLHASTSGLTFEEGEPHRLRCHFAVRFGDQETDDGGIASRADQVRRAFNSPFWPFVLATTSVGQEGLDFHPYCHAVVHWNLPTNPVDLEQREGRVHRYKGHAIRKNIAMTYGASVLDGEAADPWEQMFRVAHVERPPNATDIVPYWVFAPEGGARIERHVVSLPSSREDERASRLFRALTMYRMVFGQPRQEDLLRFLLERLPKEELADVLQLALINLAPQNFAT